MAHFLDRLAEAQVVPSEPIEVHPVAGDHILMVVEPYVQSLAMQLQQCLDKADGHLPHLCDKPSNPPFESRGNVI